MCEWDKNSSGLSTGDFSLTQMFEVLRDEESEISRGTDHKHPTTGSMVSADVHLYLCLAPAVPLPSPVHLRTVYYGYVLENRRKQ